MAALEKTLQNEEKEAMEAVWREMWRPAEKNIFAVLWHAARKNALAAYYPDDFERAAVREEASYVLDLMCSGARAQAHAHAEQNGDGGSVERRYREARREHEGRDEGAGQKLADSTALRTEAMSVLIAEITAERKDVQQYRRQRLPGGLLAADQVGDYLDCLDTEAEGELLTIAQDVCESYGLHLAQSMDLILAELPPKLNPVHAGPPRGSTVCTVQLSFAPWAAPEDAAGALRRAHLRAAALREYKARAEKAKRKAMARFEAGENPRRGPRAWRSDPALEPFRKRRPRLDVSGKRVSAPETDSLKLFIFASRLRASGVRRTWGEIKIAWNALQEKEGGKRYADERNLSKIYRRTRSALMAWLPEPPARLVLEED